jgi:hypothetical protein
MVIRRADPAPRSTDNFRVCHGCKPCGRSFISVVEVDRVKSMLNELFRSFRRWV